MESIAREGGREEGIVHFTEELSEFRCIRLRIEAMEEAVPDLVVQFVFVIHHLRPFDELTHTSHTHEIIEGLQAFLFGRTFQIADIGKLLRTPIGMSICLINVKARS